MKKPVRICRRYKGGEWPDDVCDRCQYHMELIRTIRGKLPCSCAGIFIGDQHEEDDYDRYKESCREATIAVADARHRMNEKRFGGGK